ncbi:MAG: hypothetical protein ABFS41_11635 [Myxococcota bacterium]
MRNPNMFRHPLHSFLRLVMAFSLSVAAPAFAVVDVTQVMLEVRILEVQGGASDIGIEFRVEGTDLNNGTLTLPGAPGTPIPLDPDGDDLVLEADLNTIADLNLLFPNGTYALSINAGSVTANIPYTRPGVPSPNISSPTLGQVLAPGPVEVRFTACPQCQLSEDSVVGRLEDDAMTELAMDDTLGPADTAWTPQDGMNDFMLAEASAFVARITHTAERETGVTASGDDGFPFLNRFIRSDEVAFETGFAPPIGTFCVEVNVAAPDADCAQLNDPILSILDPTGTVVTTVAGLDVEYDLVVDSKGKITGDAMADLDDNTTFETMGEVKGKLGGKEGEVKQKVSVKFRNDALDAKLKLSVKEVLSILLDAVTGTQKASGKIGDTKIKEEVPTDAMPLPVTPQGWRVEFTLDGSDTVVNPTLTLEGDPAIPLEGSNKFDIVRDLTSLKLQSPDKGIKIRLKKIGIDEGDMPQVVDGDLSYKILGQRGKRSLP